MNPNPSEYPLLNIPVPYIYQLRDARNDLNTLPMVKHDSIFLVSTNKNNDTDQQVRVKRRRLDSFDANGLNIMRDVDSRSLEMNDRAEENDFNEENNNVGVDPGFKLPATDGANSEPLSIDTPSSLVVAATESTVAAHPPTSTIQSVATATTTAVNGPASTSPMTVTVENGMLEEALPLSPTATSGMNTPTAKHGLIPLDKTTNLSTLSDELVMNNLLTNLQTQLTPIQYKNLIFKILSNLNRTALSDLNSVLNGNLKRDIVSSLPIEIALKIFQHLSYDDIFNCQSVCSNWNAIINTTPLLWKNLLISESFVSAQEVANNNNKSSFFKEKFIESLRILQNWYNPSFKPERTTLTGHATSVVTCLQFEDDYVITGADDRQLRIYDARSKKFLKELSGHEGGVWALKYDADGIIVSGSTDRSVRIWDIKRGCCTHVFKGHTSTVRCLEIVTYKNMKYIVTGSRDNTLHVWKLIKEEKFDGELPMVYNTDRKSVV